jgi:hypothetical protein
MDRYEWTVAIHEGAHCITASALGMITSQILACKRDTVLEREAGTARGMIQCSAAPGASDADTARAWMAVYFSGAMGAALAQRIQYHWLEYPEAAMMAARHRAARHRPPAPAPGVTEPAPDAPAPSSWDAPSGNDRDELSCWLHGGRGSDMSAALEWLEKVVEGIDDIAERDCARHNEVGMAQRRAYNILKDRLEDLDELATLLCRRGGRLERADLEQFFGHREAVRRMEASRDVIIG